MPKIETLQRHRLFWLVLLLHLALLLAYTTTVPLGEAPDEPAHLTYAQFIAENGRLPATLKERREAGYRSTWPPLYHILVAGPVAAVGDAPPTRLKAVGDSPRRLIPTNGQSIASFIHTEDEAWPWRGVTLAWHLGRFISVILTTSAVIVTYLIGLQLTGNRTLAAGAAALHGFLPQLLFIGSVINDDNLLVLLSGVTFLTMIVYTKQSDHPTLGQFFLLGLLLGLASAAKYNALPLWGIVPAWLLWLIWSDTRFRSAGHVALGAVALLVGAALAGGWWFVFVWLNFNQMAAQGPIAGSLAALGAGTSDAALRQVATGGGVSLPSLGAWLDWITTLFRSFWGSFGGGGTIRFPGWIYGLLAAVCLVSLLSLLWSMLLRRASPADPNTTPLSAGVSKKQLRFFLLVPLFYLPLPILRFALSGSIVETAQGRHLFPAVSLIALAFVLGLFQAGSYVKRDANFPPTRIIQLFSISVLILTLFGLNLIRSSYPPPIPLRTTEPLPIDRRLNATLAEGVTLIGYEIDPPSDGVLPLTLLWQSGSVPPEDYTIALTVTGSDGNPVGSWLGQPIGGRYPTRAWDEGDILRDSILLPLLPNLADTHAALAIRLLGSANQPTGQPLTLASNLPISPSPNLPIPPAELRSDGLPSDAPFTYRSTLSFVLPNQSAPPVLLAPDSHARQPDGFITGPTGSIAHFIVAADWPSGDYQLPAADYQLPIANRPRQFTPPPMEAPLDANFGDRITILGYDLPRRRVEPGSSFPVTLHLRAERTMGQHLAIFNHLLDAELIQRGGVDRIPKNFYTTLLWVPGEIVSDAYEVPVDPNAPPGVYWLDVGFYPNDDPAAPLPRIVDGQAIDRSSVMLGPIKVGGPPPGLTVTEPQPETELNIPFGNQITLLGFDFETTTQPTNQQTNKPPNPLTLYWQADTIPAADYTVFIHFVNDAGELIAQADAPPAGGAYPTSLWDAGEVVIDTRPLPALPPGRYELRVGLYNPITGERLAPPNSPDGSATLLRLDVDSERTTSY